MPEIQPQRLLDDLHALRRFGARDGGVVRPSLSPVDMEARRWLAARMGDAGLDAGLDGLGNVFGRSRRPGPALLLGSHSDTQPRGGWLDGALGVIYALEIARVCAEHPQRLPVDAVAWVDEEGTFSSCLGSRACCGLLGADDLDAAVDLQGRGLRDALAAAGLDGTPTPLDTERYRGYLEAHIEQGPHLDNAGLKIGVVEAIVGSRNYRLRFRGQQNHAGSTPMAVRRDAGMALIHLAYRIDGAFRSLAGPRTVWTVGKVDFDPGTSSIIPGRAEMLLQFRDPDAARLQIFDDALSDLVAAADRDGPVAVTIESGVGDAIPPATMDRGFADALAAAAARRAPDAWQRMPSAAVHDATYLSQRLPTAMLFIPSIGGVSHDFAEDTAEDDIVLGCQVLADACVDILTGA